MKEFEKIINDPRPVLVDFYATWCGPCRVMTPILEDLKKRVGNKAIIIKIDIDQSEELVLKYAVQSVPTLMIFKNGEMIWRESGIKQAHILEQILEKYY